MIRNFIFNADFLNFLIINKFTIHCVHTIDFKLDSELGSSQIFIFILNNNKF